MDLKNKVRDKEQSHSDIDLKKIFGEEWKYFKNVLFRFDDQDLERVFPFWLLIIFSSCKKLKVYVNHEEQLSNLLIHFLASQNTGKSYTVNSALSIIPQDLAIPIGSGESFKTIALRGKTHGYIVFDEVQKSFVKYLTMAKETLSAQIINIWNKGEIDNYATKQDETKVVKESTEVKNTLSKSKYDMSCSLFFIGIEKTYIEKIPKELYSDGFFARNLFVKIPTFSDDVFFKSISKEQIEDIKELRNTLKEKYQAGTEEFLDDEIQIDDEEQQNQLDTLAKEFFEANKSDNLAVNVNLDRAIKSNSMRCAGLFYVYSNKKHSFIDWFKFVLEFVIKPSIDYFKAIVEGEDEVTKIKNFFSTREKIEKFRLKERCERALGEKISKEKWFELRNDLFGLNKFGRVDDLVDPILEMEDDKFVRLYTGKKNRKTFVLPKKTRVIENMSDDDLLEKTANEIFG